MPRERILITVKTYPTLSRKYGETVCTAGIRADGSWVRIYPVPYRRLEEAEQYRKFDWIEAELERNHSDHRPETYRLRNFDDLVPVDHVGTADSWRERRRLLLQTAPVFDRMETLMDDVRPNVNRRSLAVFKPTKLRDFYWEAEEREWDPDKVAQMREKSRQIELFDDDRWRETFKVIPKLPYSFSYHFEDAAGRHSHLQVLDWECGQLFWSCVRRHGESEERALEKVRMKYWDEFGARDLHFLLGTTQQLHGFSPNPWVIIGVFAPPHVNQAEFGFEV